mmetsp:Transcript_52083/g.121098  ORF Transcript_52083/g.121098 Transcript_52083/m.121098 type:complete len:210 (-) Transcript_52083:436-1065(-)
MLGSVTCSAVLGVLPLLGLPLAEHACGPAETQGGGDLAGGVPRTGVRVCQPCVGPLGFYGNTLRHYWQHATHPWFTLVSFSQAGLAPLRECHHIRPVVACCLLFWGDRTCLVGRARREDLGVGGVQGHGTVRAGHVHVHGVVSPLLGPVALLEHHQRPGCWLGQPHDGSPHPGFGLLLACFHRHFPHRLLCRCGCEQEPEEHTPRWCQS